MSDLLEMRQVSAGYGDAVVIADIDLRAAARASRWRCSAATARARPRF